MNIPFNDVYRPTHSYVSSLIDNSRPIISQQQCCNNAAQPQREIEHLMWQKKNAFDLVLQYAAENIQSKSRKEHEMWPPEDRDLITTLMHSMVHVCTNTPAYKYMAYFQNFGFTHLKHFVLTSDMIISTVSVRFYFD